MSRWRSSLFAVVLAAAALLLSGCSTVNGLLFPPGVKLDWEALSLYVDPVANRDFPLAVDLVLVSDETLAKRVSAMKASDWFAARDGLRKTHRDDLAIVSMELAPGDTREQPVRQLSGRRVFAAMVFADYFASGEHSARLESLTGKIAIEFGATDFMVHAAEK